MKKPIKPASRPLDTPAVFATQVNVAVTDHGWRLTFGEQVTEDEASYHVGVFLPTTTAHQLTDLMMSSMQKQKGGNSV